METAALIKFGQYDHLCSLRDKGEMYMNTLPYFRKIEDDELRGDPFDSVDEVKRGNKGHGSVKDTGHTFEITNFVIRLGPDSPENINLFCMYAMRPEYGSYPINEKNVRFGDYALIFFDSQEFINRISQSVRLEKIPTQANLIEYISQNHVGEVGPFKKLETFEYQSEWRVVCQNGPGKERIIKLGNLSDICTIVKAKNINNEITFIPNKVNSLGR